MFDMIGGVGVEVGVLRHCMGRMGLEGEMESYSRMLDRAYSKNNAVCL